jgi:hypothetical protein
MSFAMRLFFKSSSGIRLFRYKNTHGRPHQAPQPVAFKPSVEIHSDVDEAGGSVFDHGTRPAFLMSLIIARRRVSMLR